MALPVWRSKGTDAHTATPTTGCTPGLPTGWAQDDIFVATVTTSDNGTLNTPAGWTLKLTQSQAASQLYIFWRRATASESAPTFDAANNNPGYILAVISAYSGCEGTSDPFHQITGANATSSTSVSFPTVTTTVADCLICNAVSVGTDSTSSTLISGWTNAALSSITERYDQATDDDVGGGLAFATAGLATAGAVGNTTATLATASGQAKVTFALMPPQVRTADFAKTLNAVTLSGAATHPDTADLSKTLSALTLSAAATHPDTGTATPTLAAVTTSAAATHPDTADSNTILADLALSAGGSVGVAGDLSKTLAAAGLIATALRERYADATPTLAAVTTSAGGSISNAGVVTTNLGALVTSAAAAAAIAAAATNSLSAATLSAAGVALDAGALAVTLGAVTLVSATLGSATGDLSKTLAPVTTSAAGSVSNAAALIKTLAPLTLTADSLVANPGVANLTLAPVTIVSAAGGVVGATVSKTLAALTATGAGVSPIGAVLSATLGAVTSSAAGTHPDTGTAALTLGAVTTAAAGSAAVVAALAKTLGVLTLTAGATHPVTANLRGQNLIGYSEEFDPVAGWSRDVAGGALAPVVTANQATNPVDGRMTADLVVFDITGGTGGDYSQLGSQGVARNIGDTFNSSFYLRTSDGSTVTMTLVNVVGNTVPITVTPAWQRFEMPGTSASVGVSTQRLRLRASESTSLFASIYMFGGQTTYGLTIQPYQRTGPAPGAPLESVGLTGAGSIPENADLSATLGAANLTATATGGPIGDLSATLQGQVSPQNQCTNYNANPAGLTNVTKSGDAASVLSVVSDTAALAAAGLDAICTAGNVFLLDNSLGTTNAFATAGGSGGSATDHVHSCWLRGSGAARLQTGSVAGPSYTLTSDYQHAVGVITHATSSQSWLIRATPGTVVYFILNQMEPGTVLGPICVTNGAAVAPGGPVAVAQVAIAAAVAANLGALTVSAAATHPDTGSFAGTLAPVAAASAGSVATGGALTKTLGPISLSAAGVVLTGGALVATLAALSLSGAGAVANVAAVAKTLGLALLTADSSIAIAANVRGVNLLTLPDGPASSYPTRSGVTDASSPIGGFANSVQFVSGGDSWAYKPLSPVLSIGVTAVLSLFIQMDDGLAPAFGSSSGSHDFAVVIQGSLATPLATFNLGGGLYRVAASVVTSGSVNNNGVVKYSTNSARGFRVTGYQLTQTSTVQPYGYGLAPMTAVSVGAAAITADLSRTLAALTGGGAGVVAIAADLARTLGPVTVLSAGTHPVTADLARTLGPLTLTAAAGVAIVGTANLTLAPATLAAVATDPVAGNLSRTLAPLSLVSAVAVSNAGTLTRTLAAVTLSATARAAIAADLSAVLGVLTGASAGSVANRANATINLSALGLSSSASVAVAASLVRTLGALVLSGQGGVAIRADLIRVLEALDLESGGVVPPLRRVIAALR